MLAAHGIYAFAPTELANNAPHMMTAFGGIPVSVVESDYEAAKALLDDVLESEPAPPPKPWWRTLSDGLVGLGVLTLFGLPPAPKPPPSGGGGPDSVEE
ncbi:hypothetical protein [Aquamicrobium sp. LC103]|uniref:hypothetical protein n=1 Tax=Aquamicrobium sp. LC103 TaxID=1120658 RepID=UPI00109D4620|nr:hypothetical protein [Aquamicrobium sp. LC103]TKT82954.1 hypothetical protein XW59_003035 [Aquamicrobium sp. LC103]